MDEILLNRIMNQYKIDKSICMKSLHELSMCTNLTDGEKILLMEFVIVGYENLREEAVKIRNQIRR